jgi:hypothetical protein
MVTRKGQSMNIKTLFESTSRNIKKEANRDPKPGRPRRDFLGEMIATTAETDPNKPAPANPTAPTPAAAPVAPAASTPVAPAPTPTTPAAPAKPALPTGQVPPVAKPSQAAVNNMTLQSKTAQALAPGIMTKPNSPITVKPGDLSGNVTVQMDGKEFRVPDANLKNLIKTGSLSVVQAESLAARVSINAEAILS